MANLEIKKPQVMRIENKSGMIKSFVPYKENFMTNLKAGTSIEFPVNTAGQVFYYLNQATQDLVVTQLEAFGNANIKVELPAKITLENSSKRIISFVPYRENFQVDIQPGEKIDLVVDYFGQVLYYLAQATEGLKISQAKVEPAEAHSARA